MTQSDKINYHKDGRCKASCFDQQQASIGVLPVMCAFLDRMDCATCKVGDE